MLVTRVDVELKCDLPDRYRLCRHHPLVAQTSDHDGSGDEDRNSLGIGDNIPQAPSLGVNKHAQDSLALGPHTGPRHSVTFEKTLN